MKPMLSIREINNIPSGRMMNAMIQEYVFHTMPTSWSNSEQKEVPVHWFEEYPRACAEDDGGSCWADFVPNYSGDVDKAMTITEAFEDKSLSTHIESPKTIFPAMEKRFWASFSNVSFEMRNQNPYRLDCWVDAETLPMAICKAALVTLL